MKITKEYLKQLIKEEIENVEEGALTKIGRSIGKKIGIWTINTQIIEGAKRSKAELEAKRAVIVPLTQERYPKAYGKIGRAHV